MIRCCVAEPLVRTRLGAFPPIITAPSHLSRFTNFGHRVCVQSVCWEQEALLQSLNKPPTHMQERERQGKKREEKGREQKEKRKKRISHIFYYFIFTICFSKAEEIVHNLQVSRQRFAACIVPQMFLLNLFVLSSPLCIILSRMCCLHKEELFCSALPENCTIKIKDRSYCKKTSSQMCQNNFQNGCHFIR